MGILMKVKLFVSDDVKDSFTEIHTNKLTNNIQKAILLLENDDDINSNKNILAVKKQQDTFLLDFEDIYMIRVENRKSIVYAENEDYTINKALYKLEEILNSNFVRISKSTIVNIKKVTRVTPSLGGMMYIELNNGLKDNISRKYLSDFKNSLDM